MTDLPAALREALDVPWPNGEQHTPESLKQTVRARAMAAFGRWAVGATQVCDCTNGLMCGACLMKDNLREAIAALEQEAK